MTMLKEYFLSGRSEFKVVLIQPGEEPQGG